MLGACGWPPQVAERAVEAVGVDVAVPSAGRGHDAADVAGVVPRTARAARGTGAVGVDVVTPAAERDVHDAGGVGVDGIELPAARAPGGECALAEETSSPAVLTVVGDWVLMTAYAGADVSG